MKVSRPALASVRSVLVAGVVSALSVLSASASITAAESQRLTFDAKASTITFELDAFLHTVHGSARLERADIRFDPEARTCSGQIEIDARSLESGNEKRDRDMHQKVLESQTFPRIVFECERFVGQLSDRGLPTGEFQVTGSLSIHGGKHPFSVKLHRGDVGGALHFVGEFEVPYVEWGMNDPSKTFLKVAKVVVIELDLAVEVSRGAADP